MCRYTSFRSGKNAAKSGRGVRAAKRISPYCIARTRLKPSTDSRRARLRAVLEVPHFVRPADQGELQRNRLDRTRTALTADPDLQGELGINADLAGTLRCFEVDNLERHGCHRARVALAHSSELFFPVRLEALERAVGCRDSSGRAQ